MEKSLIESGNKLIAHFMGGKFEEPYMDEYDEYSFKVEKVRMGGFSNRGYCSGVNNSELNANDLHFHDYPEWIWKVVEHIESLENGSWKFHVYPYQIYVVDYSTGNEEARASCEREEHKLIECMWLVIVDFIKWYNKRNELSMAKTYSTTIKIDNLTDAQLEAIEDMLYQWQRLGSIGSSRWTCFFADGDGNFRPRITMDGHDVKPTEYIADHDKWKQLKMLQKPNLNNGMKVEEWRHLNECYMIDFDGIAWPMHAAQKEGWGDRKPPEEKQPEVKVYEQPGKINVNAHWACGTGKKGEDAFCSYCGAVVTLLADIHEIDRVLCDNCAH